MIEPMHLPATLLSSVPDMAAMNSAGMNLRDMEILLIREALRRNAGNRHAAASDLGIHPATLFRKVKSLGITLPQEDGRRKQDPSSQRGG